MEILAIVSNYAAALGWAYLARTSSGPGPHIVSICTFITGTYFLLRVLGAEV